MHLHRQKKELLLLNVVLGCAVLLSYAHGLVTNPATRAALWGEIPRWLVPFYVVSMFLAAAGYLAGLFFILLRVDPDEALIAGRCRYRLFHLLYGMVLLPSALWMPLSFAMLREPSSGLWIAVRIVLAAVGLGSLGILAAILMLRPRRASPSFWLACAGSIAFCVQTSILDALVWTAFFPFSIY